MILSFIVAALIKEWTKQSKIFEPSKSRCYEKHVIQQIIRFNKKDTIKSFLKSLPLFLKIDPFHQSIVRREQGSDKIWNGKQSKQVHWEVTIFPESFLYWQGHGIRMEKMSEFKCEIEIFQIRRWNMPVVSSMQACSVFSPGMFSSFLSVVSLINSF